MKLAVVVGTRPEIIKMSSIIRELQDKNISFDIIHTGQHYSYELDKVFFEQLKLPQPKINFGVGSSSPAVQTGNIMRLMEIQIARCEKDYYDAVLVEGDTNSVLGVSLACAKLHIPIAHIEAGLRSFDRDMPEEINRILTDHCSTYLFPPTDIAKGNLLNENIDEGRYIWTVGNTIVDAVKWILRNQVSKYYDTENYILVTVHRTENVDNPQRFKAIIEGLKLVAKKFGQVIYPIHPHSQKNLKENNVDIGRIKIESPLGYFDFINKLRMARFVITDSGGVQEEACILKVPCVTLRYNTERPETLKWNMNKLANPENPQNILEICKEQYELKNRTWVNPFGDGDSGKQIVENLIDIIGSSKQ